MGELVTFIRGVTLVDAAIVYLKVLCKFVHSSEQRKQTLLDAVALASE